MHNTTFVYYVKVNSFCDGRRSDNDFQDPVVAIHEVDAKAKVIERQVSYCFMHALNSVIHSPSGLRSTSKLVACRLKSNMYYYIQSWFLLLSRTP